MPLPGVSETRLDSRDTRVLKLTPEHTSISELVAATRPPEPTRIFNRDALLALGGADKTQIASTFGGRREIILRRWKQDRAAKNTAWNLAELEGRLSDIFFQCGMDEGTLEFIEIDDINAKITEVTKKAQKLFDLTISESNALTTLKNMKVDPSCLLRIENSILGIQGEIKKLESTRTALEQLKSLIV